MLATVAFSFLLHFVFAGLPMPTVSLITSMLDTVPGHEPTSIASPQESPIPQCFPSQSTICAGASATREFSFIIAVKKSQSLCQG